jgi:hypothetical protein
MKREKGMEVRGEDKKNLSGREVRLPSVLIFQNTRP